MKKYEIMEISQFDDSKLPDIVRTVRRRPARWYEYIIIWIEEFVRKGKKS